jgi:hypothetical protein
MGKNCRSFLEEITLFPMQKEGVEWRRNEESNELPTSVKSQRRGIFPYSGIEHKYFILPRIWRTKVGFESYRGN